MCLRKCYVCKSKTSSRWFRISKEITEEVRKCFNVKEIVSAEYLCALCRQNLTLWLEGPTNASKDFVSVNSRGQPCINRSTIARKNRKTAILRYSPRLNLPEDLFLFVAGLLRLSYISRLRQSWQVCKSNLPFQIRVETVVKTRLPHTESSRRIADQCFPTLCLVIKFSSSRNARGKIIARKCPTSLTSSMQREKNF